MNRAARISVLIVLPLIASGVQSADRVSRPMVIHKVAELGLEIWTEVDPEWETRLESRNGRPVFHAETPALTYPPAGMTWSSLPELKFSTHELREAALGAVHQAAVNYGVREVNGIDLRPARHGELVGYEAEFSSRVPEGVPVDVRVFCGHQPGKPAVVVQVFTLRGKLGHVSEHIRRSWSHLRYL